MAGAEDGRLMRGVPRGRFDIVVVFGDTRVRYTSQAARSLPPDEIADRLRWFADKIERTLAHARDAREKSSPISEGE